MPPLLASKSSPGREHMTEKSYKSAQNFGSRLTLKAKDDDLLLFNQVKSQEGDNFLLHTADDFEDSLSKMRHFSDFKLGINIPTRGEAGDLLSVEGDKNDYDWLLTPPDTPLFSKLDEGVSQPIKLAPRGRIRSQPIPISKLVTEKSYRRSQTSYSPQRLNPSPRSSGTLVRVGGRSSSSTQSSPPPVIQSTTPTRGSYSPPNKPYTPTHKSSTTTLPRTSTSCSNHAPNCGGRGASPVNETHVNLSFPKSQGWQKTFPDLNSDAPPNMRASSLAPSISHVRGSSPASRNEKELSMKLRRKSMSPTSSRSFGSSHGSEEVHISSYCTYSGDFVEGSLNSRTLGVSRSPPPRKAGSLANNKAMSFSRMPSRTSPSNSAPKRSFDSALKLMDQRRIPQNMFRPLLSGVPTTTFQPIYSRNSSLTTSSSTSSDQGVIIVAEDLEGTEIEQNVLHGGQKRTEDFDTHQEVFLFDKVDDIVKDTSDETLFGNSQALCEDSGEIMRYKSDLDEIQNAIVRAAICSKCCKEFGIDEMIGIKNFCNQCAEEDRFFTAEIPSTCGPYNENDSSQVDTAVDAVIQDDIQSAIVRTAICSKCCKEFGNDETIGSKTFCNQCAEDDRFFTAEIASTCEPYNENDSSQVDTAVDAVIQERKLNCEALKFHEDDEEVSLGQHESNSALAAELSSNSVLMQWLDQNESQPSYHHLGIKMNVKDDVPEVAGISVLLQGSSSTKWPSLEGKTLSATNILSSVPSYDRHSDNVLRRNIGLDSSSTTSVVQHQLSSKTEAFGVEMDIDNDASFNSCEPRNVRNEFDGNFGSAEYLEYDSSRDMTMVSEEHGDSLDQSNLNPTTTSSSRPVIFEEYRSLHADTCRSLGNEIDEIFSSAEYLECESFSDIKVVSEDNSDTLDRSNLNSAPFSRPVISEECRFVHPDNYRAASTSEGNNDLSCSSTAEIPCADDCSSSTYTDEDHQNSGSAVVNMERATDISLCSEMAEHHIMGNYTCENVILETGTNSSSIVIIESQDGYSESMEWKNECTPSHDPTSPEHSNEHSVSQTSKNDMHLCSSESGAVVLENGASAMMVEGPRGSLSRNLTLEEATDTILFCSSIIHDLAYNAATIAAENEQEPLAEHLAPLPVTIEKSIPRLREESAKMSSKPTPKPQKLKRNTIEIRPKAPLREVVNTNIEEFTAPTDEFPRKLQVPKPPKLESKCSCSVM
ncbi:hypothetical protein KSP40_PGU019881 [Platanthera guangdongensis]|uniref:Uncharacterized protein n=1 Tax=Platanthera guangdongensis TaxID=2320717 RepID=A0ABR2LKC8_9ASPA